MFETFKSISACVKESSCKLHVCTLSQRRRVLKHNEAFTLNFVNVMKRAFVRISVYSYVFVRCEFVCVRLEVVCFRSSLLSSF